MAKMDAKVVLATGLAVTIFSLVMLFSVKYRYANTLASEGIVWWQSKTFTLLYRAAFLSGLLVTAGSGIYWLIATLKHR